MTGASEVGLVSLRGVSKVYGQGDRAVQALRDVCLDVRAGEFVSLTGPSGSGKTTLLNIVAGLDTPTAGDVLVEGRSIPSLSDVELARLRRRTLGIVFQFFNLLPTLTARDNVAVPLLADRRPWAETVERVERALAAVGVLHRADHYPSQMSGGEMQRVAIARALAIDARVLLADEPTGNLDSVRSDGILDLLRRASDRDGRAVLLVTHNPRAAAYADRQITLRDGRMVAEVTTAAGSGRVIPIPGSSAPRGTTG